MKSIKVLYIESKLRNLDINLSKEEIAKLPNKIFLAYSIQYKDLAVIIKKQLESSNIKISGFGQVLGCSKISTKDPVLLIGEGRFHAINLYLQAPEVYVLDNNKITKITENEVDSLRSKRKAALVKFLSADNIGILVSTKPGQENIALATSLKQKLKKQGKNAFIFLSNNIDLNQFENFNIDSWVNTACQGLSYDSPNIINYSEISFK
ncbi:2-(3-amino-3-carboxypropyl)histidine synthase [uncultured archaeon]|nr:2-(3-amino-3-carboxypropyl)histidine synthase [uncultured archaeon]